LTFKTIGRHWGCRLPMGPDMTLLALQDVIIDLMLTYGVSPDH
jgi:hypothetical protein